MKTSTKILSTMVVFALIIGVAVATYIMTAPDSPAVVVSDQATLSPVTVSSTVITVGDNLVLSTTVSDGTSGITVTFYNQNDIVVGSAATDGSGTAVLSITPPAGTWIYHATATHP